jgi:predicted ATPase
MNIAKEQALHSDASKFVFVSAASGSGKSSMIAQTTARVRAMIKKMNKSIVVTRHVSNEGDSRVPFSLFRSVFKDLLNELRHEEDTRSHASNRGESTFELSVEDVWDKLSLASQSSKDSIMSTDATRFRYLCDELNAPPDFADVVGRRLLGIRDKGLGSSTTGGTPDLDLIVSFLVNAFIRCTEHSDLVLLSLDDVQELDEMSFKVVQGIFERGQNVLILCGSRPPSSYQLAIDPSFWTALHGSFSDMKRFVEIDLPPLTECEVRDFIAVSLDLAPCEINDKFSQSIFTVTGGMPHFLSECINHACVSALC